MDFASLIAMLTNPGEDGVPDSIYDDLSASYTDATSTRDAKINVLQGDYDSLQQELLLAKAANWDLLQQIQAQEPQEIGGTVDPEPESEEESDEDDDEFFEDEKED